MKGLCCLFQSLIQNLLIGSPAHIITQHCSRDTFEDIESLLQLCSFMPSSLEIIGLICSTKVAQTEVNQVKKPGSFYHNGHPNIVSNIGDNALEMTLSHNYSC